MFSYELVILFIVQKISQATRRGRPIRVRDELPSEPWNMVYALEHLQDFALCIRSVDIMPNILHDVLVAIVGRRWRMRKW